MFAWHKTVGATILVLALVRLAVRLMNPPPPYPADIPKWERFAGGVEPPPFLFPADRAAADRARGRVRARRRTAGCRSSSGLALPAIPGIAKDNDFGDVHETLVWTTIALLVLHVGAALYNQFMSSNRRRRPDAAVQGAGTKPASAAARAIAPASAATPAAAVKVVAGPPRSHSRPAPRLASRAAMPLTKKKAPKLVAR